MGRWRLVAFLCGALGAACVSLSGLADPGPSTPDAAGADAADDADDTGDLRDASAATDAGSDALIPNGDFETTGIGCGPWWDSFNASLMSVTTDPHSPVTACRLCNTTGAANAFGISQKPPLSPGSWAMQAFIRASAPGGDGGVTLLFNYGLPEGGTGNASAIATPTATWEALNIAVTVPDGAQPPYSLGVIGGGPAGWCFVVDDVVIEPR